MTITGFNVRKLRKPLSTLNHETIVKALRNYKEGIFTVDGIEFKALGTFGSSIGVTWFQYTVNGQKEIGGAGAVAKLIIG
jgi:hypothetical protein